MEEDDMMGVWYWFELIEEEEKEDKGGRRRKCSPKDSQRKRADQ